MRRAWLGLVACLVTGFASAEKYGPPPACGPIDASHNALTAILQEHVDEEGLVDYAALAANRGPLQEYLQTLRKVCPAQYAALSREEQLAFWINAYNAYTLDLIVENLPLESIRDIGLLPNAAFRKSFIPLRASGTKEPLSLNDIENGMLRKHFKEPRIHFAINCASISCPALRSEAFRAATLEGQLSDMQKRFLADPTRNRYDPKSKTLQLSSIFKWFAEDFEKAAGSVPKYVAPFFAPPLSEQIAAGKVKLGYLPYDWSLNAQKKPVPAKGANVP